MTLSTGTSARETAPVTNATTTAIVTGSPRPRRSALAPRHSRVLLIVMVIYAIYTLLPLVWLLFSSTKTQAGLFSSFGLWFSGDFSFFDNLVKTLTYQDGIFVRWLGNTLLYVVVGAGGATLLATLAGYGLAKYRFPGRRAVFAIVLGAVAVPGTALAVPTFLMFSELGLTNTPWAVILPSLISPFGLYLIWVFATDAIPDELLEAARVDGAGPWRFFRDILWPLSLTNVAAIFVIQFIYGWTQYLWPLLVTNSNEMNTIVIALKKMISFADADTPWNLVMVTSVLAILPPILVVVLMQRWFVKGLVETEK